MGDPTGDRIREEQAAKRARYEANKVSIPLSSDGHELHLGDLVTVPGYFGKNGPQYVSQLTVRCWGNANDEADMEYSEVTHHFEEVGRQPMQQTWVFVDDQNSIYRPEQVTLVECVRGPA